MPRSHILRFILLIVSSIVVALVLVIVSVAMYFSSGTAQLDLSRPGYQSVRDQTNADDPYKGFPASGTVDDNALGEFGSLYKDRSGKATSVDAFNNEVMSDAALGINNPDEQVAQ